MLRKSLSILLAAGVLTIGMTAQAAEEKKQNTIQSQEQVRITEQHAAEVQTGAGTGNSSGDTIMTQERTRTRERKMEAAGDQDQLREQGRDQDRLRDQDRDQHQLRDKDRDRIHDTQGSGAGKGGSRK